MIKLSILTIIDVDLWIKDFDISILTGKNYHNKLSKSFNYADLNLLIAQNEIEFLEFFSFLNRDESSQTQVNQTIEMKYWRNYSVRNSSFSNSFYGFQVKKYHREIWGSRVESGRCQKSKTTDVAQSGRWHKDPIRTKGFGPKRPMLNIFISDFLGRMRPMSDFLK